MSNLARHFLITSILVAAVGVGTTEAQSFYCHVNGEGWTTLTANQRVTIYSGNAVVSYQVAVQPAVGPPTGVLVITDVAKETPVPPVLSFLNAAGRKIELINRSGSSREVCFAGGFIHSATGKSGFHCQDNPGVTWFSLPAGGQRQVYSGPNPSVIRIVNQPAAGYRNGLTLGLTGYELEIPPAAAFVEAEDKTINILNRGPAVREGCYLTAAGASDLESKQSTEATTNSTVPAGNLSSTSPPSGTTGLAPARSQTISATGDNTGQHPGTAAIGGPATVTCVSAASDVPNPQPPPSCNIQAPGFFGDVRVGSVVGTGGAGTVILTCNGQGNRLGCTAQVTEARKQPRSQSATAAIPVVQQNSASSQTISASFDKTGQHPGTAAIRGPSTVTCVSANSDIPNPQPRPSCNIQAPGFFGDVKVGNSIGTNGAGTVILNCNGQGNRLTCTARVQ